MKMRAAIWTDYGKIEVADAERPSPAAGQVLVRVMAAGLCVTDLHVYTGRLAYGRPPHIMGHEIAGEICGLGKGVSRDLLGRRVTIETSLGCGKCAFCLSGQRHLCPQMEEIGTAPHGGGYAQYMVCPAENAVPIPDKVSWDEAGILECAVCPMGAYYRNGLRAGETVAVYGVGPAGLTFIQGAKLLGAGKVIAVARNPARLARAARFGADVLVDSSGGDAPDRIRAETGGAGADLVCEAAGAAATVAESVDAARNGGRIFLYGIPGDGEPAQFPIMKISSKQLAIYGAAGEPRVWASLLGFVEDGRLNLREYVTHRLPLRHIARGFDMLRDKTEDPIKIVLRPQE